MRRIRTFGIRLRKIILRNLRIEFENKKITLGYLLTL